MGSAAAATLFLLPANQIKQTPLEELKRSSLFHCGRHRPTKRTRSIVPVARLFGPAIFEASKLKVLFLGVDKEKHPGHLPRTYTLTHSDVTSKLTLAISQTINRAQFQGWYSRLQRDEVVAEWKKVQGKMSLHVHCHISGGHFLLDFIARLRFYIFSKELPVVLKAFVHGDGGLFGNYPELEDALVWVYFHSNLPEFNRVECWGPLKDAASTDRDMAQAGITDPNSSSSYSTSSEPSSWVMPQRCQMDCSCCFPPSSLIPWPHDFETQHCSHQQQQQL